MPALPLELWLFAITAALLFLVGLPVIRATIKLPERTEYREVPEAELSAAQKEFFAAADRKLEALGHLPVCFFQITNLPGANLCRLYRCHAGSGIAFMAALTAVHSDRSLSTSYLEFAQDFTDGTRLSTRNVQFSSVFDDGPFDLVQELPAAAEPAELWRRHEARLRSRTSLPVDAGDKAEIFRRAEEHQRRFLEHQVARGLLRRDPAAGCYRATYWTGLNGVKNMLNPFADSFSWTRLALAAAFGLGVPAAAAAHGGGAAALAAYVAGGLAVGLVFNAKSFLWAFLLGFAASRLWPPPECLSLFPSLAMAASAELACRWRQGRERLV